MYEPRCSEIREWLSRHEVDKFAILDDDSDAEIEGNFFQTDFDIGLTEEIATKVIKHLLADTNIWTPIRPGSATTETLPGASDLAVDERDLAG